MPALLTRMSISSSHVSNSSVLLRSMTHSSPPTSAAAALVASALRSAMMTCAPRRANSCAHASPMPLAPPVTSARLPARSCSVIVLSFLTRRERVVNHSCHCCKYSVIEVLGRVAVFVALPQQEAHADQLTHAHQRPR